MLDAATIGARPSGRVSRDSSIWRLSGARRCQKERPAVGAGGRVRFLVYDQDLELHNPAADFALLEEIARITGGTAVPPGELASI